MHGYVWPIQVQHWENKDLGMKIYGQTPKSMRNKNYLHHMKSNKYCICATPMFEARCWLIRQRITNGWTNSVAISWKGLRSQQPTLGGSHLWVPMTMRHCRQCVGVRLIDPIVVKWNNYKIIFMHMLFNRSKLFC